MLVKVAVKDKVIDIQCGDGYQPVRWLADAALARYDSNNGVDLGAPTGVILKNGQALDLTARVKDALEDGAHVFVSFKDGSFV